MGFWMHLIIFYSFIGWDVKKSNIFEKLNSKTLYKINIRMGGSPHSDNALDSNIVFKNFFTSQPMTVIYDFSCVYLWITVYWYSTFNVLQTMKTKTVIIMVMVHNIALILVSKVNHSAFCVFFIQKYFKKPSLEQIQSDRFPLADNDSFANQWYDPIAYPKTQGECSWLDDL